MKKKMTAIILLSAVLHFFLMKKVEVKPLFETSSAYTAAEY